MSALAVAEDPAPFSVQVPALRAELLRRVEVDQAARNAMIEWMKLHDIPFVVDAASLGEKRKAEYENLITALREADKTNTERLREIIEKYGWPTRSLIGNDGTNAAWLLVQHADRDPKFQRQCLDMMAKLPKDEVSLRDVAYLTDRVLLAEGKKQRYGTQFTILNGKWRPRPLEDEAHVDARRAEVGLEPLAEYAQALESHYGPAK
jgi:hypothetical protein